MWEFSRQIVHGIMHGGIHNWMKPYEGIDWKIVGSFTFFTSKNPSWRETINAKIVVNFFSQSSAFILYTKKHMESNYIERCQFWEDVIWKNGSRWTLLIIKECILKDPYKCNQCGIIFNQNSLITLVNGFNLFSYQKGHTRKTLINIMNLKYLSPKAVTLCCIK